SRANPARITRNTTSPRRGRMLPPPPPDRARAGVAARTAAFGDEERASVRMPRHTLDTSETTTARGGSAGGASHRLRLPGHEAAVDAHRRLASARADARVLADLLRLRHPDLDRRVRAVRAPQRAEADQLR